MDWFRVTVRANSDDAYRKAMNQNRNGYMKETLVSNAQREVNHPTLK